MGFDYDDARATAKELIECFGGDGQLVLKGTSGGFDNDGNATPDTADSIIDGIITPLMKYTTMEINGKSILENDAWVFFHSDETPLVNMQITLNGKTFRVVDTGELSSVDDVTIYNKLQLRK